MRFVRLWAAVIVLSCLAAAPALGQDRPGTFEGRRLVQALQALQRQGLRIVFSSDVVTPEMRVIAEPRAKGARQILDEILAPHGLKAEPGPRDVIQVIRATPAPPPLRSPGDAIDTPDTGSVEGTVVDATTASPLPDVFVQIVGTRRSTRTDAAGRFRLTELRPGTQTLYVSVVGYGLVRRAIGITAGRTLGVTIALAPGTGTYTEHVTVTAPTIGRRDPGVASEMSVGSGELQNMSGVLAVDAMRTVQALPHVATGDDFRSEFSVRGSPYRHVGVVVDGVATPWLQHAVQGGSDTGTIAMFNSDILDRVRLQAGPYPRRHGDWLGAELTLSLREGSRDATQVRASASGTSGTLVTEGPLGRSSRGSWLLSVRQTYLEWPTKLLQDFGGRALAFTDTQLKLVYDVRPTQQLSITALGGRSKMDERGERLPGELALGTNRAAVLNVGWRSTAGRSLIVSQRAYLVAHRFSNVNQNGEFRGHGSDGELAYRADMVRTVRQGLFEAGGHVQRMRGARRTASDGFDGSAWARSGYAHFKWTAGPLTLAPGVRVADSTLVDRPAIGRWLLGEWTLPRQWTITAATGVSHQFPEFEHVLGAAGSRLLKAERASYLDVGLERQLTPAVRWQATLFRRAESDVLRAPDVHPRFQNALEGTARGLELLLERRGVTGISGWLAYSYGKTRYDDRERHESFWGDFDQRHAINIAGVYRLRERTSLAVKFRAGSNVPIPGYLTTREGRLFAGDRRNDVRLPTYARLDARANRTFHYGRRRLTLFVEVLNVLNRTNLGLTDGFISRATGEAVGFTETLFPRLPSAGVLIEF